MLREGAWVKDVGDVLLSRQHQLPRVWECGCDRPDLGHGRVRAFLAGHEQDGDPDPRCLFWVQSGLSLA